MINRPDPSELTDVPVGERKVSVKADARVPNCFYLLLQREDHTVGNLLRMQLLRDPSVMFAGYRNPHPLEPTIEIRVQSTASGSPYNATFAACAALCSETASIKSQMLQQIRRYKEANC